MELNDLQFDRCTCWNPSPTGRDPQCPMHGTCICAPYERDLACPLHREPRGDGGERGESPSGDLPSTPRARVPTPFRAVGEFVVTRDGLTIAGCTGSIRGVLSERTYPGEWAQRIADALNAADQPDDLNAECNGMADKLVRIIDGIERGQLLQEWAKDLSFIAHRLRRIHHRAGTAGNAAAGASGWFSSDQAKRRFLVAVNDCDGRGVAYLSTAEKIADALAACLRDQLLVVVELSEWDPPVCRLQLPDGSVPGNAREAAEAWHAAHDRASARASAFKAERDCAMRQLAEARADAECQRDNCGALVRSWSWVQEAHDRGEFEGIAAWAKPSASAARMLVEHWKDRALAAEARLDPAAEYGQNGRDSGESGAKADAVASVVPKPETGLESQKTEAGLPGLDFDAIGKYVAVDGHQWAGKVEGWQTNSAGEAFYHVRPPANQPAVWIEADRCEFIEQPPAEDPYFGPTEVYPSDDEPDFEPVAEVAIPEGGEAVISADFPGVTSRAQAERQSLRNMRGRDFVREKADWSMRLDLHDADTAAEAAKCDKIWIEGRLFRRVDDPPVEPIEGQEFHTVTEYPDAKGGNPVMTVTHAIGRRVIEIDTSHKVDAVNVNGVRFEPVKL